MATRSVRVLSLLFVFVLLLSSCSPTFQFQAAALSGLQGKSLQAAACTNVALNKQVNVSSTLAGWPASAAVDGSLATAWNAGDWPPQWIEINLGGKFDISEIRLHVETFPNTKATHEIYVSTATNSAADYKKVDTHTDVMMDGETIVRSFPSGLAAVQWVKIVSIDDPADTTDAKSWVAWQEIEVCQTTLPPTNTPTSTPVLPVCGNQALNKTANASINSDTAYRAIDGSVATIWNAADFPPQWIEVNLGSLHTVEEIRLYAEQTPNGNTTHEVWIADASKAYTKLVTFSGYTVDGQILYQVYTPGLNFQWIKIVTTSGPSWVAWQEIQLCRTAISSTLTPTGTATPTATGTAVNTSTATGTSTATKTSTATPTVTASRTSTSTSTATPTKTSVPASTSTATATATSTSVVATYTATSTPTAVSPATHTATATPTFTAVPGNTHTSTPTMTPTTHFTFTPTVTASSTFTPTATAVVNTPGKVTGGGNLGDKATFGLTVQYKQGDSAPKGNLEYIDHTTGMNFKATTLETLVIEGDTAWFTGWGTINGGQTVWFEVQVKDTNKQGATDWFRITIPDLSYEMSGAIDGGNITIHK